MKQQINEIRRIQQLAGILKENQETNTVINANFESNNQEEILAANLISGFDEDMTSFGDIEDLSSLPGYEDLKDLEEIKQIFDSWPNVFYIKPVGDFARSYFSDEDVKPIRIIKTGEYKYKTDDDMFTQSS